MAGIEMGVLLKSIVEQLQPSDVKELKYILKDSFPGMFHWILSPEMTANITFKTM